MVFLCSITKIKRVKEAETKNKKALWRHTISQIKSTEISTKIEDPVYREIYKMYVT